MATALAFFQPEVAASELRRRGWQKDPWTGRWHQMPPFEHCRARVPHKGEPCRKSAVLGGTLCAVHGGVPPGGTRPLMYVLLTLDDAVSYALRHGPPQVYRVRDLRFHIELGSNQGAVSLDRLADSFRGAADAVAACTRAFQLPQRMAWTGHARLDPRVAARLAERLRQAASNHRHWRRQRIVNMLYKARTHP